MLTLLIILRISAVLMDVLPVFVVLLSASYFYLCFNLDTDLIRLMLFWLNMLVLSEVFELSES